MDILIASVPKTPMDRLLDEIRSNVLNDSTHFTAKSIEIKKNRQTKINSIAYTDFGRIIKIEFLIVFHHSFMRSKSLKCKCINHNNNQINLMEAYLTSFGCKHCNHSHFQNRDNY